MRVLAVLTALSVLVGPAPATAQGNPAISSAEPFKLGTFDIGGEPRIGIVLRDTLVVDLAAANRVLAARPGLSADARCRRRWSTSSGATSTG